MYHARQAPERSMLTDVLPTDCRNLESLEANNIPVKVGTVLKMLKAFEEKSPGVLKCVSFDNAVDSGGVTSESEKAEVEALSADARYDVVFDQRDHGFSFKYCVK